MSDASDYRRLIESLAKGQVNQRIPNSLPLHASILLETMFRFAREDIRIFSGALAAPVYDQSELIDSVGRFLSRPGTRLRILLQQRQERSWI